MNFRLLLAYVLVFAMAVTGPEATAQRRAATKSKTRSTTVKSSAGLPNALGRDTYTMIKRDIKLKYVGPNTEDEASYTTDVIDIEWPVDIRLISYSGKSASEDSIVHRRQIEEIQARLVYVLFNVDSVSDINKEIDKLMHPGKDWNVVSSVPRRAYSRDNERTPRDNKISVKSYLTCDKWLCFEIGDYNENGEYGNRLGWPDWITIPRDRTVWNRTDISLISALDPSNYTNKVRSAYADEILSLIKKAAGDSDGLISSDKGMRFPNRMRPEKTGITFIYYMPLGWWVEYFVSYDDLEPYLEPSVYNVLAGGKNWSE